MIYVVFFIVQLVCMYVMFGVGMRKGFSYAMKLVNEAIEKRKKELK
jgi:hypothetical protein